MPSEVGGTREGADSSWLPQRKGSREKENSNKLEGVIPFQPSSEVEEHCFFPLPLATQARLARCRREHRGREEQKVGHGGL